MTLTKPAALQVLANARLHVGEPHERQIGAALMLILAVCDQTPQKWEDWIAELAGLLEEERLKLYQVVEVVSPKAFNANLLAQSTMYRVRDKWFSAFSYQKALIIED
jgi:hypothetical protein